ncbi:MAG: chemotaxis protein CheX [Planctomycetes bacterium]|nr:chemotaxis protein CheX [Planctomycetota bacterium]
MITLNATEAEEHVRAVWSDALGVPVVPAAYVDVGQCRDFLTGVVAIEGTWRGVVELRCHESAAWHAMNAMCPSDDQIVSMDMLEDIVGELTNITAGGIKAMLAEDCSLSLPMVFDSEHAANPPEPFEAIAEYGFLCGGEPVFVRVLALIE